MGNGINANHIKNIREWITLIVSTVTLIGIVYGFLMQPWINISNLKYEINILKHDIANIKTDISLIKGKILGIR